MSVFNIFSPKTACALEKDLQKSTDVWILNTTAFSILNEIEQVEIPKSFCKRAELGVTVADFGPQIAVEMEKPDAIKMSPEKFIMNPYSRHKIIFKSTHFQRWNSYFCPAVDENNELIAQLYLEAERQIFVITENGRKPVIEPIQEKSKKLKQSVKDYDESLTNYEKSNPEKPDYVVGRADVKFDDVVSNQSQNGAKDVKIDLTGDELKNFQGNFGVNYADASGNVEVKTKGLKIENSNANIAENFIGKDAEKRGQQRREKQEDHNRAMQNAENVKKRIDETKKDREKKENKLETELSKDKPNDRMIALYEGQVAKCDAELTKLEKDYTDIMMNNK